MGNEQLTVKKSTTSLSTIGWPVCFILFSVIIVALIVLIIILIQKYRTNQLFEDKFNELETKNRNLSTEIYSLMQESTAQQGEYAPIFGKNETLKAEIAKLQSKCQKSLEEVENLKEKLKILNTELLTTGNKAYVFANAHVNTGVSIGLKYYKLSTEWEKLTAQKELGMLMNENRKKIQSFQSSNKTLKEDKNKKQKELQTSKNDFETLKKKHKDNVLYISDMEKKLESDKEKIKQKIDPTNGTNDLTMDTLKSQINKLKSSINSQLNQLSELKNKKERADLNFTDRTNTTADFASKEAKLKIDFADTREKLLLHQQAIEEFSKKIDLTNESLNEVQSNNAILEKENTDILQQINTEQANATKLEKECNEFTKNCKKNLANLTQKRKQHDTSVGKNLEWKEKLTKEKELNKILQQNCSDLSKQNTEHSKTIEEHSETIKIKTKELSELQSQLPTFSNFETQKNKPRSGIRKTFSHVLSILKLTDHQSDTPSHDMLGTSDLQTSIDKLKANINKIELENSELKKQLNPHLTKNS